MSTHIDQLVTEVVPEAPLANKQETRGDLRWSEKLKHEALVTSLQRQRQRLRAEGFDD